jgi:hypothetical protein
MPTIKAPTGNDERLRFKTNKNPGPGYYPISPVR